MVGQFTLLYLYTLRMYPFPLLVSFVACPIKYISMRISQISSESQELILDWCAWRLELRTET